MTIYIDCTSIVATELNTGIQRVERNLIGALVDDAFTRGESIVPVVCFDGFRGVEWETFKTKGSTEALGYFYSVKVRAREIRRLRRLVEAVFPVLGFQRWIHRRWKGRGVLPLAAIFGTVAATLGVITLALPSVRWGGRYYEPTAGDVVFLPGSSWWDFGGILDRVRDARNHGAIVCAFVHDLFPINHPEWFDSKHVSTFDNSLRRLVHSVDLLIGNSNATKKDVIDYLRANFPLFDGSVGYVHLGADHDMSLHATVPRSQLSRVFEAGDSVFVSIGTIEPRKNHAFILDAFEGLWSQGGTQKLCLVGRFGWKSEYVKQRILENVFLNDRLFWFSDLTDGEVAYCYAHAKSVILAAFAEGFGLPLVEALAAGCVVYASDIPIFREVGGERCRFFSLSDVESLRLLISGEPQSEGVSVEKGSVDRVFISRTWCDAANELITVVENFRSAL